MNEKQRQKLSISEVRSKAPFVVIRLRDLFVTPEHTSSSAALLAFNKLADATKEELGIYRQTRDGWEKY